MLEEIGISDKPITAYQIKNIINRTGDVYRIIYNLCPSTVGTAYIKEKYLLNFDEMLKRRNTKKYNFFLYRRLLKIFKIKRDVPCSEMRCVEVKDEKYYNNHFLIEFRGDKNKKWIIYSDEIESKHYFSFLLNPYGYGRLTLYDANDCYLDSRRIRYHNTKKGMCLYVEVLGPYASNFLYVDFSEKCQKEIRAHEKRERSKDSLNHEISSVMLERSNWEFTLNLRGLLLYLLEISSKKERRVREVLRNLSSKYDKIFPFLLNWENFEKAGFAVLDVLLRISREYAAFLNHPAWTDDYLLREITKRYYKELSGYFRFKDKKLIVKEIDSNAPQVSSEKIDSETLLNLNKYRRQILGLIKKWLEQELENVNKDFENYSSQVSTSIDHSSKY